MSQGMIAFTRDKYTSLKDAYDSAVKEGKREFTWTEMENPGRFARKVKDHVMVTRYAKYVLEYLSGQFSRMPDVPAQPNNEGEEGQ